MAAGPSDQYRGAAVAVQLDAATIQAIALRVAEIMSAQRITSQEMHTAGQIAVQFGVSRSWVYENAAYLGAIRLGDGARPRLRFDPDVVAERLRRGSGRVAEQSGPADTATNVPEADLIPIRGL